MLGSLKRANILDKDKNKWRYKKKQCKKVGKREKQQQ